MKTKKPQASKIDKYELYLMSDHWKKLRQDAINRYGYKCEMCQKVTGWVQVHHIQYRNLYDVRISDLIVLCKCCHKIVHNNINRGNKPATRDETVALGFEVDERLENIEKKISRTNKANYLTRLEEQRRINNQLNKERYKKTAKNSAKTLKRPKVRKKGRRATRVNSDG